MSKQKTAVDWLIQKITNRQNGVFDGLPHLSLDEIYSKAKELERQQIIDAYKEGDDHGFTANDSYNIGEEADYYFTETFEQ